MAYERKNGQGILFKVNNKKGPSFPDFEGNILIDGVERRLAAWTKESATGTKYLSVSLSDTFKKEEKPKQVIEKTVALEDITDSDLPF